MILLYVSFGINTSANNSFNVHNGPKAAEFIKVFTFFYLCLLNYLFSFGWCYFVLPLLFILIHFNIFFILFAGCCDQMAPSKTTVSNFESISAAKGVKRGIIVVLFLENFPCYHISISIHLF